MRTLLCATMALMMLSAVSLSSAQDVAQQHDARVAEKERQLIRQQNAQINSAVRLQECLSDIPVASPLRALPAAARDRFVSALTFNEQGLSGMRIDDVEEYLTVSEAHQLLSLFGVERVIAQLSGLRDDGDLDRRIRATYQRNDLGTSPILDDHGGYKCNGRANCIKAEDNICMSSC